MGDNGERAPRLSAVGDYPRTFDEKLRVGLPKPVREALGLGDAGVLIVAPAPNRSLALYPEESFARLAEVLSEASPAGQEVLAFTRLFYAQARRVELDAQWRVRIPVELAQWAELGKEVMLIGVRDRVELWAAPRWKAYLAEQQARFDQIAEAAFGK